MNKKDFIIVTLLAICCILLSNIEFNISIQVESPDDIYMYPDSTIQVGDYMYAPFEITERGIEYTKI